ncbi:hypothetical protein [Nitrosomonas halophila]|uniref:Uncharacterized protein n=1 Tax=Nitrosomonas halophila TaxID=44576 RepID=A0A1H3NJI4_9PROT|nr:hypothetical protein [Nitrosomonas halophila]SDY89096.1 hypothetical protein SAMN05421881_10754 [Nitrosomonas halophila]
MSGGQTKNAALTTALAFHYQVLIGLDKCFSLDEGQSVWFEKDGDVSLISPDALASTQTEVKDYAAPLTDHHENLWKTLKNWLTPEFDHTQYGVLVLHTTQAFGATTRLKDWNKQSDMERLKVLKAIFSERTEEQVNANKPSEIVKLQKTVMIDTAHQDLMTVLAKVVLHVESEDLDALMHTGSGLDTIHSTPAILSIQPTIASCNPHSSTVSFIGCRKGFSSSITKHKLESLIPSPALDAGLHLPAP